MRKLALIVAVLAVGALAEEESENPPEEKHDGITVGIRGGVHLMTTGILDWSAGWHVGAVHDALKITSSSTTGSVRVTIGLNL
jgi:hypothetical protein